MLCGCGFHRREAARRWWWFGAAKFTFSSLCFLREEFLNANVFGFARLFVSTFLGGSVTPPVAGKHFIQNIVGQRAQNLGVESPTIGGVHSVLKVRVCCPSHLLQ